MSITEYQNPTGAKTGLSPAHKAWETRRARAAAQGQVFTPQRRAKIDLSAIDAVLAEADQVDGQAMPDWHAMVLKMKRVLVETKATTTASRSVATSAPDTGFHRTTGRPTALPAPKWPDYPVDHLSSFNVRNPTIVVTFADGREVRAPAVSAKGKPLNIGRGLRIAIVFYQHRTYRQLGIRRGRPDWIMVPAIVSCIAEETGETFDAGECTARTVDARKGNGLRAPHSAFKLRPKMIGGPANG